MNYNENGNYGPRTFEEEYATIKGMNSFISKVYGWMFLGLLLTAGIAFYAVSNFNLVYTIASNRMLFFALLISELLVVIVLTARITKMKYLNMENVQ